MTLLTNPPEMGAFLLRKDLKRITFDFAEGCVTCFVQVCPDGEFSRTYRKAFFKEITPFDILVMLDQGHTDPEDWEITT